MAPPRRRNPPGWISMDRNQLIIAAAAGLLAAFVLGWLMGALLARLSRNGRAGMEEVADLTRQLIRAEGERDDASAHFHRREAEMEGALTKSVEALELARLEIEELRAYIDKHLRQG